MTPLGPAEMRARNRPFVVLGIAAVRLLGGFALALPLSTLLGESGIGQTSAGDRVLFESGGYLLLEVLRLKGGDLAATARGMLPLLALGLALTVTCNAALLMALNVRGRLKLGVWLASALSRTPAFLVLGCAAGLLQLLLLTGGVFAIDAIPEPLDRPLLTSAAQLGMCVVVAALAGAVGGFSDVVKASLVRHEAPLAAALGHAWQCQRQRPIATCLGWLPFAAASGLALLLATQLTETLDVSRPGSWRLVAVFGIHQLVIGFGVLMRAAWFARALRLTASHVASISARAALPELAQVPR